MNVFFDTSALVKFFHEEEGTKIVTDLILDGNNQVWVLELARLEFISAVFRRFRNREMDEVKMAKPKPAPLWVVFLLTYNARNSIIVQFKRTVLNCEGRLCRRLMSLNYEVIYPIIWPRPVPARHLLLPQGDVLWPAFPPRRM